MACFYFVTIGDRERVIAAITEEYHKYLLAGQPEFYLHLRYHAISSEDSFSMWQLRLPFHLKSHEPVPLSQLGSDELFFFKFHQNLVSLYRDSGLEPKPWWIILRSYQSGYLKLSHFLTDTAMTSSRPLFKGALDYYMIEYGTEFKPLLNKYFDSNPPKNNSSEKLLRVDQCDGINGVLFLLIDANLSIVGTSAVFVSMEKTTPVARIYSRFHLRKEVPHSLIDRLIEPAMCDWCEKRGIFNVYLTINESQHKTLEWVARRMGERRHLKRKNIHSGQLGAHVRSSIHPHQKVIMERGVWQYVFFSSVHGDYFLERPEKDLDPKAKEILMENYHDYTQNWHRL